MMLKKNTLNRPSRRFFYSIIYVFLESRPMTELTQECKDEYRECSPEELENIFLGACRMNYMDIIRYLLTSTEWRQYSDVKFNKNMGLYMAIREGRLEVVKYLLTSPELSEHADIHGDNDKALKFACRYGRLDIVQYLLNSSDLKEYANIHADEYEAFKWAGAGRYFQIVAYLVSLTGPHYIDFQRKEYNLDWAIKHHHSTTIEAMMLSLKRNDYLQYMDCLPKVEEYCLLTGQEDIYNAIVAHDVADNNIIVDESFVMV